MSASAASAPDPLLRLLTYLADVVEEQPQHVAQAQTLLHSLQRLDLAAAGTEAKSMASALDGRLGRAVAVA